MANKNLFYSLYSHSQEKLNPGYVCSNAVDESAVSFDIQGSDGVITDSNGTTLSTIDLSAVHAAGLTQYNTETRIIQPYSCCLLQGQEYGLANATYYFLIPKHFHETQDYEKFCNVELDVVYNNFSPEIFHVSATANGRDSIADLINDAFETNNIKVSVSLQCIEDEKDHIVKEYLVFLSQEEGYFYFIMNLKLMPIMASEDWPDSPFSNVIDDPREVIYNLLIQYHPVMKDEEYDPETYQIDCDLYTWLIKNYKEAIEQLDSFSAAIECILGTDNIYYGEGIPDDMENNDENGTDTSVNIPGDSNEDIDPEISNNDIDDEPNNDETGNTNDDPDESGDSDEPEDPSEEDEPEIPSSDNTNTTYYPGITEDMSEEEINEIIELANSFIAGTVFDNKILDNYDTNNLDIIRNILLALKAIQHQYDEYYPTQMWLIEDKHRRVPLMKYPNGAFRGIVLVPDFPRDSDYEYSSLWVNHVKDMVTLYNKVEDGHYTKKNYGVLSNATLMNEDKGRKHKHICSNISLVTALEDGWEEIIGCHCDDNAYNITNKEYDDTVYMGQSRYSRKSDVIGLFRYIQYVNDEHNWLNIGDLYVAIGKDDDPNEKTRNLPTSMLIYNPNSIPVRIKYMIFS